MPVKKPTLAEKRKRRLQGGYPLSTGLTPAKPPKTRSGVSMVSAPHTKAIKANEKLRKSTRKKAKKRAVGKK